LGSRLAASLKKSGITPILTSATADTARGIERLNLADGDAVIRSVTRWMPGIVYHTGALVDLTRDFDIARKVAAANIIGTTNLLLALRQNPPVRFIYMSTEEVYGRGVLPYRENALVLPPSPYAVTKMAAEHMCRMFANEQGISVIVMRAGTMYGPGQPIHRYIAQTIVKALKNEDIPLNSGTKKRDYVYVDDVVSALVAAGEAKMPSLYEVINLGGGVRCR